MLLLLLPRKLQKRGEDTITLNHFVLGSRSTGQGGRTDRESEC